MRALATRLMIIQINIIPDEPINEVNSKVKHHTYMVPKFQHIVTNFRMYFKLAKNSTRAMQQSLAKLSDIKC